MFWKKEKAALEEVRHQAVRADREKEAARLNFHRSLRRLARKLEEIPLEDGLCSIGGDLAGNRK